MKDGAWVDVAGEAEARSAESGVLSAEWVVAKGKGRVDEGLIDAVEVPLWGRVAGVIIVIASDQDDLK